MESKARQWKVKGIAEGRGQAVKFTRKVMEMEGLTSAPSLSVPLISSANAYLVKTPLYCR